MTAVGGVYFVERNQDHRERMEHRLEITKYTIRLARKMTHFLNYVSIHYKFRNVHLIIKVTFVT